MSFEDFIKYFGEIELVNLDPMRMLSNETRMATSFNMNSVRGKWVSENSPPQYRLIVKLKHLSSFECKYLS